MAPDVSLEPPWATTLFSKFMSSSSLVINCLTTYLIVMKSAKMRVYKWLLLYYVYSSCSFDVFVSILFDPVLLLPYYAGYPTGPLYKLFGISAHAQLVVMIGLIINQSIAIAMATYYRFQPPNSRFRMSRAANVFGIPVFCVLSQTPVVMASFGGISREQLKPYLVENDPSALWLLSEPSVQFYDFNLNPWLVMAVFLLAVWVMTGVGLGVFIVTVTRLTLMGKFGSVDFMSGRTRAAHLQLLKCLVIQMIIPTVSLMGPMVMIISAIVFRINFQYLGHLALAIMSIHSPVSSLLFIFLTKPYRATVVKWIQKAKGKKQTLPSSRTTVSVIPSVGSGRRRVEMSQAMTSVHE